LSQSGSAEKQSYLENVGEVTKIEDVVEFDGGWQERLSDAAMKQQAGVYYM